MPWFRRIGEVEDVEPAPGADQFRAVLGWVGEIVDFTLPMSCQQLGRTVMARIVSRRAVEITAVNFKTVSEVAKLKRADLAERAHVVRVEDGDASAAPFSGVQKAVSVAIRLRLARLADAEMPRMVRIGNVDGLDAVDPLGEEDRLADDVNSRRELDGIVARAEAHVLRIVHIDDTQTHQMSSAVSITHLV